jgi:Cu+-exporting ATPase
VAAIIGLNNATKENILTIAVSLEKSSEHPLAKAIIEKAAEQKITPLAVEKFQAWPGQGITGQITGQKYYLGNARMLEGLGIAFDSELIQEFSGWGQTPLILADESKVLGIIAVADVLKENALESVKILQGLGLKVIMLTGDHKFTADYIGRAAQVDEIIAEALPATKAEKITALKYANELVAMVGDGVNDSVALSAADIGIAMANGSDIAIEAADITILHGDLSKIITAIKISRLTMKKIRQNLFWAFFYNLAALPIAAGLLYPFFGLLLNPAIAALAMSLSSVSVVTNSLLMKRARF